MSMPKGHKSSHGYATVSKVEHAMDYRKIAEYMTGQGYKMNHATARNVFVRAMSKLAKPIFELYGVPTDSKSIMAAAQDPRFQEGIIELVSDILSNEMPAPNV